MKNIHRKIMIALTALIFGSVGAWLKSQWRDADRYERKWMVGLAVVAVGVAIVGALRAVGVL